MIYVMSTFQTSAALEVFMLAMSLYPDVMRRAQAEIDAIVGQDRLPTFKDQSDLPYITAIVKEVLRWQSVSGFGMLSVHLVVRR